MSIYLFQLIIMYHTVIIQLSYGYFYQNIKYVISILKRKSDDHCVAGFWLEPC